ncbi:hypothetical protein HNR46_004099 [Haloferula luteola]|uniref:Uncharacterized protein n=1 Tax=Haloferula luteola TaxID=595692 RepID=A0A840V735_9BACT|nr:hypothetical protein [Haloferula luteola]
MNPAFYIRVFAWISITGLGCMIFASSWLPILSGTVIFTALIYSFKPPSN